MFKKLLEEWGLSPLLLFLSLMATVLHAILSEKTERWWKYAILIILSAVLSAYLGPELAHLLGFKGFGEKLSTVLLAYLMLDFAKSPKRFIQQLVNLKNKWVSN